MLDSRGRRDPLAAASRCPAVAAVRVVASRHRLSNDRMIDDVEIPTHGGRPQAPGPSGSRGNGGGGRSRGPRVPWRWRRRFRHPGKPRVKKLRLLLILFGLGILAVISTVFGMMMAVASD